ncbi:MAG: hypothetical protein OXH00_01955 [Candidatus Poribacteria bacterium]|nr:hypothetical protein [Candidatus Poribacteria bacterium]
MPVSLISDIAGQDIQAHNNSSRAVITRVRNWLRAASRREAIPSGGIVWERYQKFKEKLPQMAKEGQLIVEELIFNDYTLLVAQWLENEGN